MQMNEQKNKQKEWTKEKKIPCWSEILHSLQGNRTFSRPVKEQINEWTDI